MTSITKTEATNIITSLFSSSALRGAFDNGNGSDPSSVYPEMKGIGGSTPWNPPAPVYLDGESGLLHSKYILIDPDFPSSDPIVETGSFNFSTAATTGNDENFLLIYDSLVANQYLQDFAKRYTLAGGTIKVEMISSVIPDNFLLSQNYPNPFNPRTEISYEVPAAKLVKLTVYNILGKEMAELVNERQSPGKYKVSFDASNLTSGVYFYTLSTDNFTETKRMILLK